MYSEHVIDATIEDFSRRNGWRPEFHTVAQADNFSEYIDSITAVRKTKTTQYFYWKDGKAPKAERVKWIKRWIENEQFCSFSSAEYFITRYGKIRDAEERIVHFRFRLAQRLLLNAMAECDDQQVAIQLFCLKARQLGISTAVAQFFLHRILFRPHTYAIMASVQIPQSEKLAAMIETTWSRLPFWLVPPKSSLKAKEPRWTNGSMLSVQAGGQEVGIAQGTSPSCIHICLHPKTLIHLADGQVKEISEVDTGDSVITSRGRVRKVKASVLSPRGAEVACEMSLWGNYAPLIVTRDHPILTPEGFVEAENLEKGDFVSMPVRPIRRKIKEIELEHRPTGWHGHRGSRTEASQKIELSREWGWMCGFYLSEGSLHRNCRLEGNPADSVYFSIHRKEGERCTLALSAAVGMFQKIGHYSSKSSLSDCLVLGNAALARWLEQNFGSGAANKRVPDWVFDAGKPFAEGLLKGYLEGDAHISPRCSTVIAHSISMPLLLQVRDLMASLGIGWSSLYHKEAGMKYGRDCAEQWSLGVNGDSSRRLRSRMGWPQVGIENPSVVARTRKWTYSPDGKFVYIKVFENRPIPCESFYDLEVDAPEHDFCTIHCCVKNSELGDYSNPKHVLEEGLFPACHPTRSLFMVLEGTGSTATTWQKEKWDYYTENRDNGGRFTPFFIPPACARDLYPHGDWLKANPIPVGWEPSDRTRKMRRRGELFVRSTDYLWKVLGQHWEMDKEFQWYWECLFKEAVASHSEHEMLSQYAATPEDAFQSKDAPVFTAETIEVISKERERNYAAYAVTGKTILMGNENVPYQPNREDVDETQQEIVLDWEANDGNEYRWNLIPLKPFDDSSDQNCFDKLLIFKAPEDGSDPAIGIDTAHGLNTPNEDRSSLTVHQNNHGTEPDIQMASFTSLRVNSPQMARIAAAVAVLYGTDGNKNVVSANPLLVKFIIEQVRKPGDECQHQLKIMGFLDHHIMHRYDAKGNIEANRGSQEGWYTRAYTRSILLDRFVDAVNSGWLILHDPIVLRQLTTFVRKYKEKGLAEMVHETGAHDDGVFSAAMAWTTAHDLENTAMRIASRYPIPRREKQVTDQYCERFMVLD